VAGNVRNAKIKRRLRRSGVRDKPTIASSGQEESKVWDALRFAINLRSRSSTGALIRARDQA
jgi:hypothetical protein